ncbi:MAG: DoxX family membrane protein, partial [Dysgonamonadaceae bacterium]|nr:DoxX family membrane protein [Dysgonamonadaceae bacterium]
MKVKSNFLNFTISTARILFGLTFMFSGFVKAIDPLGFSYKIEDYIISFNFLQVAPLAFTLAVILILLEFVLGVLIFFGIYRRITSLFAFLFMAAMIPLTLYIALKNPVQDCGCFGDALIISNWDTFFKNIVLFLFSIT